jgi:hypothetical protein
MNQYPNIRNSVTCPNCQESKSIGLVLCWPCHHKQKHRNDGCYSKRVESKLERIEKESAT